VHYERLLRVCILSLLHLLEELDQHLVVLGDA
jgi:hypothetical protein